MSLPADFYTLHMSPIRESGATLTTDKHGDSPCLLRSWSAVVALLAVFFWGQVSAFADGENDAAYVPHVASELAVATAWQLSASPAVAVPCAKAHGHSPYWVVTDALGHVTSFRFDNNGNQIEERRTRTLRASDGSSSTETLITRMSYDAQGRVVAITYPDGSVTATVDQFCG